jgi:hypothetical protein
MTYAYWAAIVVLRVIRILGVGAQIGAVARAGKALGRDAESV